MRTFITACLISGCLMGGGVFAAAAADTNEPVLNIGQVYAKLESAGYSQINEIERKYRGYSVKAMNPQGQRVKLHVDARTAEVLNQRSRDNDRNYDDNRRRDCEKASF